MPLRAVIRRVPPWDLEEWTALASGHSACRVPAARSIVNPFTKRPTVVEPGEGVYNVLSDEAIVGAIEPSSDFSEDGDLHVFSPEQVNPNLRNIVQQFADVLDATLIWIDEP